MVLEPLGEANGEPYGVAVRVAQCLALGIADRLAQLVAVLRTQRSAQHEPDVQPEHDAVEIAERESNGKPEHGAVDEPLDESNREPYGQSERGAVGQPDDETNGEPYDQPERGTVGQPDDEPNGGPHGEPVGEADQGTDPVPFDRVPYFLSNNDVSNKQTNTITNRIPNQGNSEAKRAPIVPADRVADRVSNRRNAGAVVEPHDSAAKRAPVAAADRGHSADRAPDASSHGNPLGIPDGFVPGGCDVGKGGRVLWKRPCGPGRQPIVHIKRARNARV